MIYEEWIRPAVTGAALLALAGCSTIQSLTGATTPWTPIASADVEVNAGLGAVVYLKTFETQVPNAKAAVQAACVAIAAGINSAANTRAAGGSAGVQTASDAASAVLAAAPQLSTILTTKVSGSGSAITVAADLAEFLVSDAIYVVPSVSNANAGATTQAQLTADETALTAAGGGC